MYYIIRTNKDEYLVNCDLSIKEIEVTSNDTEAWQFASRHRADWIADRVGGEVLEIN